MPLMRCCAAALALTASVRAAWPVELRLRNGDVLHGDVLEMSAADVLFRPQGSDVPLRVGVTELADLRGSSPVAGEGALTHQLRLQAGGLLRGELESEEDVSFHIRLQCGQRLAVPKAQVEAVDPLDGVWRGPVEKSLLSIQPGNVRYRRPEFTEQEFGGLRVGRGWRTGIPLPDTLPEAFLLLMDVAFPEDPRMAFSLFTASERPGIFEGLQLLPQGNRVLLNWKGPDGRLVRHSFDVPDGTGTARRLMLEVDQAAREFRLWQGGQRSAPIPMQAFEIPERPWIVANGDPAPVVLRDLLLIPGNAPPPEEIPSPNGGAGLRTAAGDVWMAVESVMMEEGMLVARARGWPEALNIPLEQVSVLRFGDAGASEGNLLLANGGRLHAELRGFESGALVFEMPWSEDRLRLPASALRAWTSADTELAAEEGAWLEFRFAQGHSLRGTLEGWDADGFRVRTVWGQALSFPAERVLRVTRVPPRPLLDGLADPESWRFRSITAIDRESPPRFDAGWLWFPGLSNQRMSLPLPELPDRFVLEAEMELSAGAPAYSLSILPRVDSDAREAFLQLHVREREVTGRQDGGAAAMDIQWREDVRDMGQIQEIRLYVDQQMGRMTLFMNGALLNAWPMVRGEGLGIPAGSVLQIATDPMEAMHLRRLRILNWDGPVPDFESAGNPPFLVLRNGDVLTMEKATAEEGTLRVQQEGGMTLPIPVAVTEEIHLPGHRARPLARPAEGVLLYARDAGMVMPVRLLGSEDGMLLAESPLTPDRLNIPVTMVSRLSAWGADSGRRGE